MSRIAVYRECPFCNEKVARCLTRHLGYHGKTLVDYTLAKTGLSQIPKCANPECNNFVTVNYLKPEEFYMYCSSGCATRHKVILGIHQYQKQNRPVDEFGRDVIVQGIIDRGNNPLQSKNRKLDENGNDIMAKKGAKTRAELGLNPFEGENAKKYNIFEKAMASKSITGHYSSRTGDPNVIANLYVGLFNKEGLIKVGVSRNLEKRLYTYSLSGIEFDELLTKTGNEQDMCKLESRLKEEFNQYRRPLDSTKYQNPAKDTFQTLGHTEWFSSEIYDTIKSTLNDYNVESSDSKCQDALA